MRIFFWKDVFFPVAIFSQKNIKTEMDFRNYDNDAPNRLVAYTLPKGIKKKTIQIDEERFA